MADWLKVFVLAPHVRVLAVNELPAGGTESAVRLEANVFGHHVEKRFTMTSQAEADFGFAEMSEIGAAYWLASEGAKREASHAGCL